MHKVPSPTTRALTVALATFLTALMITAAPASAADPPSPGNFKGYGFDACVAPSQKIMNQWNLKSPYSAIGIYISGNSRYCGDKYQPNLSKAWVQKNADNGWRFLPIHVGYQSPCFKNNPKSRVQKKHMSKTVSTARSQAVSDAKESMAAATKYGFSAGAVLYLDLEWYARTKACDNVTLEFIDAWTEQLHKSDFKSGVYSSGSAAIKVVDEARKAKRAGFTLPDHMWIAWTNKKANTDGGSFLSDAGWDNHQRIHQYHNGVNQKYGGYTLNIDKNFLDVGKGAVATDDPKPCGVRMSFTSYPRLKSGSTRAEVSTLQCILKELGLKSTVTGGFGPGTKAGVNAFRAKLGWSKSGVVTRATWTALLSVGSKPRVMKYGSVGDAVWRLQRALNASGHHVAITGKHGAETVTAVKAYRKKHGLANYSTTESSVWSLLATGHHD